MSNVSAKWLLVLYRPREISGPVQPIGVALYLPPDSLYFKFRDDLNYVDEEDLEIVAMCAETLRQYAREMGAQATFHWMADTLSNVIFVEGPHDLIVDDPQKALTDLFVARVWETLRS